ncbi:RNA polymerase sigma factor [Bacteroides sp. 51]|uniref:RNA polymerase sigma factor n=1 Tax=Bacteroides sp. 51 TaxID=2302938 RepID=UPI0013D2950B|nr:RNA polymerase sigma-70 factor [Bacteroides sp. 51]
MDDFELFNRIKLRDRAAFDTLFRKYYTPLCRFSFATCLSKEDAEENVQDMFVHLWEKAPTLEVTASIKAYLYTSVRNHTLNAIRKRQTELCHIESGTGESGESGEAPEPGFYAGGEPEWEAGGSASEAEIARLIQSGVELLPEKCREIFVLCKQEGLTYDEIATYLNVSGKTVDNQMRIALRKLREYLRPKLQKILAIVFLFLFT